MKALKRFIDITVSLVSIVLCLPIFILIALAIALDSPGPILYRKKIDGSHVYRIGAYGRPFRYFKFRSMKHPNSGWKQEVTRVGNFLRRWHLDELPELFLVLSGKMSLVGLRPCTYGDAQKYPDSYFAAWTVKPGMTGPSQLKGRFIPVSEKVETDLKYIKSQNVIWDLMMVFATPVVIFRQRKQSHF